MSGVLGWGRTLSPSPMKARKLVESVEQASIGPKCDVWGVSFKKFESMARFNTMCNYFSIGADAKASRLFENHRTSRPKLYRSQSFNKASYAAFGGFLALKGSSSIGKRIKHLIVDGKEVPVPQNAKALIVLNIPSYAGKSCQIPLPSEEFAFQECTLTFNARFPILFSPLSAFCSRWHKAVECRKESPTLQRGSN